MKNETQTIIAELTDQGFDPENLISRETAEKILRGLREDCADINDRADQERYRGMFRGLRDAEVDIMHYYETSEGAFASGDDVYFVFRGDCGMPDHFVRVNHPWAEVAE